MCVRVEIYQDQVFSFECRRWQALQSTLSLVTHIRSLNYQNQNELLSTCLTRTLLWQANTLIRFSRVFKKKKKRKRIYVCVSWLPLYNRKNESNNSKCAQFCDETITLVE